MARRWRAKPSWRWFRVRGRILGKLEGKVAIVSGSGRGIGRALALAGPGDTVLIAGKGSEDYQLVGDQVLPFLDTAVVRELTRTA